MRLLIISSSLLFASIVHAAGLAGTYVIENPQGRIVARIKVNGDRLSGNIDVAGRTELKLSGAVNGDTASGTVTSKDGTGAFEAALEADILRITISQKDGPNQKAATLPLEFRRAGAEAGAPAAAPAQDGGVGDSRLLGTWSHQDLIVSGNASFASEEHLAFRADGTYVYGKAGAAAGGDDWSFDGGTGGKVERGRWRAQDGILYVMGPNGEWVRAGKYGMTDDGRTMRITYEGGNRKLWERQ